MRRDVITLTRTLADGCTASPETRMKLYPFIVVSYISDCIPAAAPRTQRVQTEPRMITEFGFDPQHPVSDSLGTECVHGVGLSFVDSTP